VSLWNRGIKFSQSLPKQSRVKRSLRSCGTEKFTSKESSEIDQGIEDIFVATAGWRTLHRGVGREGLVF
jgi:hypothetical protein